MSAKNEPNSHQICTIQPASGCQDCRFGNELRHHAPGPMSHAEKAQLLPGLAILAGFPLPVLLLGQQYLLAGLTAGGGIMFFWMLRKYTCTQCVNFPCPLNLVSHRLVDASLQRNPTMQQAWKAAGWQVGGNQDV